MKTARLTKKQLTELKKNGKLWSRKYYYELVEPGIIKYHEIYRWTDKGKRIVTDEYAKWANMWTWAKVKE